VEHVFHEIHQSALGRTKIKLSRTKSSSVGNQPLSGSNAATAGQGNLSTTNGTWAGGGGRVTQATGTLKV
jgi:hypothetical protein